MNIRKLASFVPVEFTQESWLDPVVCHGGGGKGGGTTTEYIPAPIPPAPPAEEATMEEFTDEEEMKNQRKAMIEGAKSLQIPLGTAGGSTVGTV